MDSLKKLIAKLVVDNLDNKSSSSPLSARCGYVLQKEIDDLNERIKQLEKKIGG